MTSVDQALHAIRAAMLAALLCAGLGSALAPLPSTQSEQRVIRFRDATPAESLLHDLQAERDRLAAEREADGNP